MNSQNIAVCFGPVLLTQNQEPRRSGTGTGTSNRSYAHSEDIASAVDFKRHIEVLHYLLQAWPGEQGRGYTCTPCPFLGGFLHSNYLGHHWWQLLQGSVTPISLLLGGASWLWKVSVNPLPCVTIPSSCSSGL